MSFEEFSITGGGGGGAGLGFMGCEGRILSSSTKIIAFYNIGGFQNSFNKGTRFCSVLQL